MIKPIPDITAPIQHNEIMTEGELNTTSSNSSQANDEEKAELIEWRKKREQRLRRLEQDKPDNDSALLQQLSEAVGRKNVKFRGDERNDSEEYISAAKRRKMEEQSLLEEVAAAGDTVSSIAAKRRLLAQQRHESLKKDNQSSILGKVNDESRADEDRVDARFASASDNQVLKDNATTENGDKDPDKKESLLEETQNMTSAERAERQRKDEEERILKEASKVQTNALVSAKERSKDTRYTNPMPTSWRIPSAILQQGPEVWQKVRDEWHMEVQGEDVPPPMKRFVDMRFPEPIIKILHEEMGIKKPTPIQIQGLPVALAGRDMVGIAFTGSGKTLTFSLPLVMAALEEELRMPLIANEGPVGIILAPSRELARQTYDQVVRFCKAIGGAEEYPELRCQLLIGGENIREQMQVVRQQGVHCVVATPGRLRGLLKTRDLNLLICRYICLDEADRMLDLGFDEEVGEIMNYFPRQRQTLLFSATFPKKFQDFARQTLVKPIVVNVGRAGAANLDVIQEVEYVKEEAKIVYLLHCLQKTAPPVVIFSERKQLVDDIHEYLLLKGVAAVSIHGGKDQEERNGAIKQFKEKSKDVLIATDIAAKGLDFPDIQHVINFDMPTEIENYVHRIGRTGRCGKTGVATTFINKSCDETTLLDLKALLKEARQRIPPVLMMLEDPREKNGGMGCSFCGGLGHTIVDCPKIDKDARRVAGNQKDSLAGGGDW